MKLAVVPNPHQSRQHDPQLVERAKAHYPNSENYQQQWIRMVNLLRAGRGWVLEGAPVNWHADRK